MGSMNSVNSVTGTLDSNRHSIGGTSTEKLAGHMVESMDLTTSYTIAQAPNQARTCRALIVNEGANEIRVRVRFAASGPTQWDYYPIPAGRFMEIREKGPGGVSDTMILEIAVCSLTSTSRAIVHQIWR